MECVELMENGGEAREITIQAQLNHTSDKIRYRNTGLLLCGGGSPDGSYIPCGDEMETVNRLLCI